MNDGLIEAEHQIMPGVHWCSGFDVPIGIAADLSQERQIQRDTSVIALPVFL
jgi:hypothetical protein